MQPQLRLSTKLAHRMVIGDAASHQHEQSTLQHLTSKSCIAVAMFQLQDRHASIIQHADCQIAELRALLAARCWNCHVRQLVAERATMLLFRRHSHVYALCQ